MVFGFFGGFFHLKNVSNADVVISKNVKCGVKIIKYIIVFMKYVFVFMKYVVFMKYIINFMKYILLALWNILLGLSNVIGFMKYVINFMKYVIDSKLNGLFLILSSQCSTTGIIRAVVILSVNFYFILFIIFLVVLTICSYYKEKKKVKNVEYLKNIFLQTLFEPISMNRKCQLYDITIWAVLHKQR